jgi:predicted permease
MEWWRKLRHLAASRANEQEMEEEIRFHLESRVAELEAEGVPPREAQRLARREFGGTVRVREEAREAWRLGWLADLAADLRHAARSFAKSPGFVTVAVLSLALGIGANTAIFSIATAFLFNRPSARDASTLARFRVGGASHLPVNYLEFLRAQKPFEDIAGVGEERWVNWTRDAETRRTSAFVVSGNFFDMVGVPLAMGRGLRPGEDNTVVVGHFFWQAQLNGNPDILGRSLVLDGKPYTVVGVLPRDHRTVSGFGLSPNLYIPAERDNGMLAVIARLPQGMTGAEALERMGTAARELQRVHPGNGHNWAENLRYFPVEGLESFGALGPGQPLLMFFGLLWAVVLLVLLIACANVSGLLLARMASRRQEIAVQLSLGAPRNRILRQCFAESLLLAALGTAAGLGLNRLLIALIARIEIPVPLSIRLVADVDDRLALYACAIALLCSVAVGVAPALHALRESVLSGLKQSERTAGSRQRLRRVLVVGQMAVCTVLLATGFLFLRNLQESAAMDVGFDTGNTVWASVRLLDSRYRDGESRAAFAREMLDEMQRLPGVESATVANWIPLTDGRSRRTPIRTAFSPDPVTPRFTWMHVGPRYFETLGIAIRQGREFSEFDREGSSMVVILNERMAKHLFGEVDPIGQPLRMRDETVLTVVGVAANSKYGMIGETGEMAMYEPWFQKLDEGRATEFVVRVPGSDGRGNRASGPHAAVVESLRALLLRRDSSAAVEVKPISQALGLALFPSRAGAALLGGFGALGLLLAAVGLGGMIAYSVQGRTKEIGLRMAMGASAGAIFAMVAREASWIAGIGLALGLTAAFFAVQPLTAFLVPGLAPADPLAFSLVVAVLLVVSLAATLAPARKALGVEPLRALREE